MDIQSRALHFPTLRGAAERSTENLVARRALPASRVEGDTALSTPSPLRQAALINNNPGGLSAKQAAAVYDSVQRIADHSSGGELMSRVDTRV